MRRRAPGAGRARTIALATALGVTGIALVAAGASVERREGESARWTVRQAESIATVRGQPVHVKACRGIGPVLREAGVARYRRFACTAGTGLDWESFDSVSVTYVLIPLGPYAGDCSAHATRDVHFIGGTGVP